MLNKNACFILPNSFGGQGELDKMKIIWTV